VEISELLAAGAFPCSDNVIAQSNLDEAIGRDEVCMVTGCKFKSSSGYAVSDEEVQKFQDAGDIERQLRPRHLQLMDEV
jgi:hypothetical protein